MPVTRKRPCCICHRWFRPDNRIGSRQRACSRPACQALRRRRKQATWRARNPDYFAGRRIQARMAVDPPPEPLRLPSPLNRLPWEIAQSELGVQGADFISGMGALLVHSAHSRIPPGAELICRGDVVHAAGFPPTRAAPGASSGAPAAVAGVVGGQRSADADHRGSSRAAGSISGHRRLPIAD